jgi:hypothetical protein
MPGEPLTMDDNHTPCWHASLYPIAENHGQYQYGTPLVQASHQRVIVCCWCNGQLLQELTDPVPVTHTGARVGRLPVPAGA